MAKAGRRVSSTPTEGTLCQRGKARIWYWKYRVNNRTVWKNLGTASRAEAQRLRAAAMVEYGKSEPPKPTEERNPTIEEFLAWYFPYMQREGQRITTLKNHKSFLLTVARYSRAERLGDITGDVMEQFKHHRKSKGFADSSFNVIRRDVRTMYRIAIENGRFTGENPTDKVQKYKRLDRPLITFHTEGELLRLLDAAREVGQYTEWIVLLGGWGGLRRNEIVNLVWEHLNFNPMEPTIRIAPVGDFRPKNKQERIIPMNRRVYDGLYPHRKAAGYLFESHGGGGGRIGLYRYDGIKGLYTALERAGLDTKDPFQKLRRSFGSILAQRGVSPFLVAKWAGHTIRVAEDHYWGQGGYDANINAF